jgi:hypothetical protein
LILVERQVQHSAQPHHRTISARSARADPLERVLGTRYITRRTVCHWVAAVGHLFQIDEVVIPDIELLSGLPLPNVWSCIKPGSDSAQSRIRIVRTSTQFYNDVKLVFLSTTPTVTPVCFDGFFDECIKKLVESIPAIPDDDQLSAPLGKFPAMLFFPKSLLHLSLLLSCAAHDRLTMLTGMARFIAMSGAATR